MTSVVLFASRNGATRNSAMKISETINADLIDLRIENSPDVSGYDVVILGSGVYSGKPTRIIKFAKDHSDILSTKRVFVFLCCLYNGEKGDAQLESVVSQMPPISGKTYFSERSPDVSKDIDDFIERLI